jgi:hypothetical protein
MIHNKAIAAEIKLIMLRKSPNWQAAQFSSLFLIPTTIARIILTHTKNAVILAKRMCKHCLKLCFILDLWDEEQENLPFVFF